MNDDIYLLKFYFNALKWIVENVSLKFWYKFYSKI